MQALGPMFKQISYDFGKLILNLLIFVTLLFPMYLLKIVLQLRCTFVGRYTRNWTTNSYWVLPHARKFVVFIPHLCIMRWEVS